MVEVWSDWHYLPDACHRERLQAPTGPGLYEVREFDSGEVIAFDYAAHVAKTLANIALEDPTSILRRLTHPRRISPHHRDIEYRTLATATTTEAKIVASDFRDRRHAIICQRSGLHQAGV